jgi:hypothetical protein
MLCGTKLLVWIQYRLLARWRQPKTIYSPRCPSSIYPLVILKSIFTLVAIKLILTKSMSRGDIVSYQNYVLSRMPQVWGDDASAFNPYRWFNEKGDPVSYSPFSLLYLITRELF